MSTHCEEKPKILCRTVMGTEAKYNAHKAQLKGCTNFHPQNWQDGQDALKGVTDLTLCLDGECDGSCKKVHLREVREPARAASPPNFDDFASDVEDAADEVAGEAADGSPPAAESVKSILWALQEIAKIGESKNKTVAENAKTCVVGIEKWLALAAKGAESMLEEFMDAAAAPVGSGFNVDAEPYTPIAAGPPEPAPPAGPPEPTGPTEPIQKSKTRRRRGGSSRKE